MVEAGCGVPERILPRYFANFSIPSMPFFGRLEYTTFRAGVAVNQNQIFTSLPLSQLGFLLGLYVSPEDNAMRWYFGAGALVRFSWPGGGALVVDNLLPFAVRLAAGTDFPLFGPVRAFAELTPTAYYTPLPVLFLASLAATATARVMARSRTSLSLHCLHSTCSRFVSG